MSEMCESAAIRCVHHTRVILSTEVSSALAPSALRLWQGSTRLLSQSRDARNSLRCRST